MMVITCGGVPPYSNPLTKYGKTLFNKNPVVIKSMMSETVNKIVIVIVRIGNILIGYHVTVLFYLHGIEWLPIYITVDVCQLISTAFQICSNLIQLHGARLLPFHQKVRRNWSQLAVSVSQRGS